MSDGATLIHVLLAGVGAGVLGRLLGVRETLLGYLGVGCLGAFLGPWIGDWIVGREPVVLRVGRAAVPVLFTLAGCLVALLAMKLVRGSAWPRARRRRAS